MEPINPHVFLAPLILFTEYDKQVLISLCLCLVDYSNRACPGFFRGPPSRSMGLLENTWIALTGTNVLVNGEVVLDFTHALFLSVYLLYVESYLFVIFFICCMGSNKDFPNLNLNLTSNQVFENCQLENSHWKINYIVTTEYIIFAQNQHSIFKFHYFMLMLNGEC